jgi:hypothetical protein
VFSLIVGNIQSMLTQLGSGGGTVISTVAGLAEIIFSTIAAFVAQLPASTSATKLKTLVASDSFRIGVNQFTYVPKHRTRRAFKKDWNKVAAAGGHPEVELKLSFFEHL